MILVIAVLLRAILLDVKPVHFDEGINGWFLEQIWREGFYRYDPENYHGPLYFYILQLGEVVLGHSLVAMRLVTGLISAATVLIVLLHARWFGKAMYWAAALLAVSPGMVFYGRYAIHESLFVLMQAIFIYGFFRWKFEGGRVAVLALVIGIVGCVATKETFIIFFGTWLIATLLIPLMFRLDDRLSAQLPLSGLRRARKMFDDSNTPVCDREPVPPEFVVATIAAGLFVLSLLFSGFFFNLDGITDGFRSIAFWSQTGAEGTGHVKPFSYWLLLLLRYELPCIMALVCIPLLWFRRSAALWQMSLVALGIVLAYSIIPYKTPWLIIGQILPLAFVFGFLVDTLGVLRAKNTPGAIPLIAVLLLAISLTISVRLNFRDYVNFTEPYVYVQTSLDVPVVKRMVDMVAEQAPQERNMNILFLDQNFWPLPWLFGEYPNVEFGKIDSISSADQDVMTAEAGDEEKLEALLMDRYYRFPFLLRDSASTGSVYFRQSLFEPVVAQIIDPAAVTIVP